MIPAHDREERHEFLADKLANSRPVLSSRVTASHRWLLESKSVKLQDMYQNTYFRFRISDLHPFLINAKPQNQLYIKVNSNKISAFIRRLITSVCSTKYTKTVIALIL